MDSVSFSEEPTGIITTTSLSERTISATIPQLYELEQLFKKFDTNGDGKISSSELGSILSRFGHPFIEELDETVKEFDLEFDGFIDFRKFVEVMNNERLEMQDLKEVFSAFDKDGNGYITAGELYEVFKCCGEDCTIGECRKMISAVDSNGDGMVDFNEFKVMMTAMKDSSVSEDLRRMEMVPPVAHPQKSHPSYNIEVSTFIGCIPYRHRSGSNELEVVLITSKKGQGMKFPKCVRKSGEAMEETASQEALVKAGVAGNLEEGMWNLISITNEKISEVYMFPLHVKEQLEEWPEKNVRQRIWPLLGHQKNNSRLRSTGWTRSKVSLGRLFVIINFLLEIPTVVLGQLSSPQKPQYALVSMVISFAALFLCIVELGCRGRKENVVWKWRGTLPWLYYPSQDHHKPFGTFKDIVGSVCIFCQCIVTAINYAHVGAIKVSVWPIIFAFGLLCSKMLEN